MVDKDSLQRQLQHAAHKDLCNQCKLQDKNTNCNYILSTDVRYSFFCNKLTLKYSIVNAPTISLTMDDELHVNVSLKKFIVFCTVDIPTTFFTMIAAAR